MIRQALYIIAILLPSLALCQFPFQADTVRFIKVSGPELAGIYKNDLLFDQQGVLWVAAQTGLFAYDGYDWKSALAQPSDPMVNVDQWLESVQEDSSRGIWFGTHTTGLFQLDRTSGAVTAYSPTEFSGDSLHNYLYHELPLTNEYLILPTPRGFLRFNPYTQEYIDVHVPYPEEKHLRLNQIQSYSLDKHDANIAWLGTRGGVIQYNLERRCSCEDGRYSNHLRHL